MSLILQRCVIFLINFKIAPSSWLAYMLFLVFVGGLLVIFVYLSALIPNELFKTLKTAQLIFLATLLYSSFSLGKKLMRYEHSLSPIPIKFRNIFINNVIILILIYLVIFLFVAINITRTLKSPIKQKIYEQFA